jgi:hypothetical protein
VGFEPTIPASERARTVHALDRAATVTGSERARTVHALDRAATVAGAEDITNHNYLFNDLIVEVM